MKVRFPIYFEVVGYQEIDLPDDIDPDDEDAIKRYIDDSWGDIPFPDLCDCEEIVDGCQFDWESDIAILDD